METKYLDLQYNLEQAAYRLAVAVEAKLTSPQYYVEDSYLLDCVKEVKDAQKAIVNYVRGGDLQDFKKKFSEVLLQSEGETK